MDPGRKRSGGWLKKKKKDREGKHANNGSPWLLRLAVGQGYLCRSAGFCRVKLERSKIWETSAHRWENLHDEMVSSGMDSCTGRSAFVWLQHVFVHLSLCGFLTCCIQSCVPLLVSCSQMLWAESVRATAHTLFFTCISRWFIYHKKHICVNHPCSMLMTQPALRRMLVLDNIWATETVML